jgi:DNA-binding helix-hairpin-helix protein with protein kinase domain/Flp pilus assembly protein TadD
VGLLMPRIEAHHPIHVLYGPTDRAAVFPDATWAFLIRAARNLAAAFDIVHQHDHVLGDVNQGNVVVSREATVRLLDCDSFQVSCKGRIFPCRVGVPLFTPPELQGRRLEDVVRTKDHDRFGLAVLVFHLLFMGRHPWAGRHPTRAINVDTAIKEGMFAFGSEAEKQGWLPPPFSLHLADIPVALVRLFEGALGREGAAGRARPAAAQWVAVLEAVEHDTTTCSEDARHVHVTGDTGCPWCRIEREGGPAFFLLSPGAPGDFEPGAFWRAVEALRSPGLAAVPNPRAPALSSSPPPATNTRIVRLKAAASGLLALLARVAPPRQMQAVAAWERELRGLERLWLRESGDAVFTKKRRELETARADHDALAALERSEQKSLAEPFREAALLRHLQGFRLGTSVLPGLGTAELARLAMHGVTTAADISGPALLAIRRIDLDLVRVLLLYRDSVMRSFAADPIMWAPAESRRGLLERQATRRKKVEGGLRAGFDELIASRRRTFARRAELTRELHDAYEQLENAKAGRLTFPKGRLPALPPPAASQQASSSGPTATVPGRRSAGPSYALWPLLFIVLLYLPGLSKILSWFPSSSDPQNAPRPGAVASPVVPADKELAAGLERALEHVRAARYPQAANEYLDLLVKHPERRFDLLRDLGRVRYLGGDWAHAEMTLTEALGLRPNDPVTSSLLAMVYERTGQPVKAQEVLARAAAAHPEDARVQYNAGIFHLNAGKSAEAIHFFRRTIAADPSFEDAYYHLGTLMVGQNDAPEAVRLLKKYLSLEPGNGSNADTARKLLTALKPYVESGK